MPDTDAPDTGNDAETKPETTEEPSPDVLQAEVDKWKALSRKHEEKAKANAAAAKELEQVRMSSMSDQEKAVETARAEARAEALREVGSVRVDDAVRIAAAGREVDVDALLEGLDRSRFLTDDGQPDTDAVTAWVDRIAPVKEATPSFPDLGQGARGTPAVALNDDALTAALKSKLGVR